MAALPEQWPVNDRVIDISGLTKTYGAVRAVDSLDLRIGSGEIFGFLGPNGAGKTTTIRMLMGILVPTSGTVNIGGLDSRRDGARIKRLVGYLPDQPGFHDYLRGVEIVEFVGQMHGQSRKAARGNALRLLEELDLADAAAEFAVNYSLGMKKKLGLACALIHDPPILILDEPTSGLDPRAAKDLLERLRMSVEAGKTIFLSTHLLEMVERICSRVGVIHRGRLVGCGRVEEVKARAGTAGSLEEAFFELTRSDDAVVRVEQ